MNKKGQVGIAIIGAIMIFMVGMLTINILKPEITIARGATGLDCANVTNISDGTKLTCLAVDFSLPYFILIIFSATGGVLMARLVGGNK